MLITREVRRFFGAVKKEFPDILFSEYALSNSGVAVLVYVYEHLLFQVKGKKAAEKEEYLEEAMNVLGEYLSKADYQKYIDRSSSEAGRSSVANEFLRIIAVDIGDEELEGKIENTDFGKEMAKLERLLGKFVNTRLHKDLKEGVDWYKNELPHIYDRMKSRMKEQPNVGSGEMHEYLTFGEIKEIIKKEQDLFEPHFIKGDLFDNWDEFYGALKRLSHYRNQEAHGRSNPITAEDERFGKMYIRKIRQAIE